MNSPRPIVGPVDLAQLAHRFRFSWLESQSALGLQSMARDANRGSPHLVAETDCISLVFGGSAPILLGSYCAIRAG